MTNEEIRPLLIRKLSGGQRWLGIFENQALDSADCGSRAALAFPDANWDAAIVGTTRAPDQKYVLVEKCRTPDHALEALNRTNWELVETAMIRQAKDTP